MLYEKKKIIGRNKYLINHIIVMIKVNFDVNKLVLNSKILWRWFKVFILLKINKSKLVLEMNLLEFLEFFKIFLN